MKSIKGRGSGSTSSFVSIEMLTSSPSLEDEEMDKAIKHLFKILSEKGNGSTSESLPESLKVILNHPDHLRTLNGYLDKKENHNLLNKFLSENNYSLELLKAIKSYSYLVINSVNLEERAKSVVHKIEKYKADENHTLPLFSLEEVWLFDHLGSNVHDRVTKLIDGGKSDEFPIIKIISRFMELKETCNEILEKKLGKLESGDIGLEDTKLLYAYKNKTIKNNPIDSQAKGGRSYDRSYLQMLLTGYDVSHAGMVLKENNKCKRVDSDDEGIRNMEITLGMSYYTAYCRIDHAKLISEKTKQCLTDKGIKDINVFVEKKYKEALERVLKNKDHKYWEPDTVNTRNRRTFSIIPAAIATTFWPEKTNPQDRPMPKDVICSEFSLRCLIYTLDEFRETIAAEIPDINKESIFSRPIIPLDVFKKPPHTGELTKILEGLIHNGMAKNIPLE